jgi:hypothetical protein
MTNIFKAQVIKLLTEDEEQDELALQQGLDQDTAPDAFNDVPDVPVETSEMSAVGKSTQQLNDWINKIEDFTEYLNGLSPNSINYELNRADCSTIMADVQRSETKKISRVAQDLSSLAQSLKQYLLGAERKTREAQANIG